MNYPYCWELVYFSLLAKRSRLIWENKKNLHGLKISFYVCKRKTYRVSHWKKAFICADRDLARRLLCHAMVESWICQRTNSSTLTCITKFLSNSHCWSIGSFYSCNKNSKELNCEIKKLRPWCIDRNKSGREWRRLIQILKLETINGHIHRLWPAAQTEIFVFLPQQIYQLLFGFFFSSVCYIIVWQNIFF